MQRPKKKKARSRESVARTTATAAAPVASESSSGSEDQIYASNLTLHELFEQQTANMLERADLSEEQKQNLLIGMSCPCCGAGGFSFTAKLRKD